MTIPPRFPPFTVSFPASASYAGLGASPMLQAGRYDLCGAGTVLFWSDCPQSQQLRCHSQSREMSWL